MMATRTRRGVLYVAVAGVFLAGCGGAASATTEAALPNTDVPATSAAAPTTAEPALGADYSCADHDHDHDRGCGGGVGSACWCARRSGGEPGAVRRSSLSWVRWSPFAVPFPDSKALVGSRGPARDGNVRVMLSFDGVKGPQSFDEVTALYVSTLEAAGYRTTVADSATEVATVVERTITGSGPGLDEFEITLKEVTLTHKDQVTKSTHVTIAVVVPSP